MSKNSTIGSRLADRLVDVVDNVRRKIHGRLGTRPWRVSIVTRRWSGDVAGVGSPTISILDLDPPPKVTRSPSDRMGPGGRESTGKITITEVSLRYTERELQPEVDARTEVAYRITESHGQRQETIWAVLSADPTPRRGDHSGDAIDWKLTLNETAAMSGLDGENSP